MKFELKSGEDTDLEYTYNVPNTGNWGRCQDGIIFISDPIEMGNKTLTITFLNEDGTTTANLRNLRFEGVDGTIETSTLYTYKYVGDIQNDACDTIAIAPLQDTYINGSYIDWNNCDLTDAKIENDGANIGSTGASTVASFAIQNTMEQDYILTFATGSKNAAKMKVTLTENSNGNVILEKDVDIENTGSWTPSQVTNLPIDALPVGTYTLKFAIAEASSYAGNWGKLAFYTTDAINIEVEVGDKPKVEAAVYDYVVSTAEEFSAAIVAVNETNKQKDAARKVIFVKNGGYDFGSTEQNLKAYNVSIIEESMDGVLLHGLRSDISNPILQINNTGGKQAVFKHIAMQSQQDTQVTGESGYITAPATSPLLKWGYVFQGCTINGYKGSYTYTSGYTLGRPWQNEPRCYVIFKDGAYLTNQTSTAYVATEQGTYTVRSANRNGGLCGTSNAVTVSDSKFDDSSTGILSPSIEIREEAVPLFNLAGQRVGKDYRGIIVKNGKKFVKK